MPENILYMTLNFVLLLSVCRCYLISVREFKSAITDQIFKVHLILPTILISSLGLKQNVRKTAFLHHTSWISFNCKGGLDMC